MLTNTKIIGLNWDLKPDFFKIGDIVSIKYESTKGYWAIKTFVGICIAKKNKKKNTKIILRNVITYTAVEYNFFLYCTDIVEVKKLEKKKNLSLRKSKLYYLRLAKLNKSKV